MLLKLYEKNNNPKDLDRIIETLQAGGLIIYPTDTSMPSASRVKRTCHERYLQVQKYRPTQESIYQLFATI